MVTVSAWAAALSPRVKAVSGKSTERRIHLFKGLNIVRLHRWMALFEVIAIVVPARSLL
jgi:hypothetical protein